MEASGSLMYLYQLKQASKIIVHSSRINGRASALTFMIRRFVGYKVDMRKSLSISKVQLYDECVVYISRNPQFATSDRILHKKYTKAESRV